MKLSLKWLNEYVSTEGISAEELADKLLNIGFEVEEIIYTGAEINKVVTGKILDIKKHMDADKLRVCIVDIGSEITTIVTGADNIKQGDTVPVALDGATLPGGKTINSAPLRGVMSYGMMCSGSELGIDDSVIEGAEIHGILILPEIAAGTDIKEVLRLNDTILDISVTANRPDCQSVYGMAREVAAVLGRKLKPLDLKYKTVHADFSPTVQIKDDVCSKYTCRVIDKVKIQQSPEWMRDRLRSVGVRPINNVVDITNYVLFEVGQPLHAFDTRFVSNLGIIVRRAENGEVITALDGKEYSLTDKMTVIADSEKSLAIAGVMGGEYSGINENTSSVLLESARFAKGNIRSTSRALGLRSDSSARYEKGVDLFGVDVGRERALALFYLLKAGRITDAAAEDSATDVKTKTITTTSKQISELLGIEIKQTVIVKILKSLMFDVQTEGNKLTVKVPLFREDVENYTDLAEEVIRYYGYDNIKSAFMPTAKCTAGGTDTREHNINAIKSLLCGFGAYEILTYSFISKKALDKIYVPQNSNLRRQIEILNPLSEEYSVMRTQLATNMLSVVARNLSRKNKDFRLFEVSKTYIPESYPLTELPNERDVLCFAFVGKNESFYTVKAAVTELFRKFGIAISRAEYSFAEYYHPGISCDCYCGENKICSFGKIHPLVAKNYDIAEENVFMCEMELGDFICKPMPKIEFTPLPKYQAVERDLAVTVKEEVPVGNLINAIKAVEPLVSDCELFDIYRGEQIEDGYKSVALSFRLSAPDRTLNEESINAAVKNILSALEIKFGAKLR